MAKLVIRYILTYILSNKRITFPHFFLLANVAKNVEKQAEINDVAHYFNDMGCAKSTSAVHDFIRSNVRFAFREQKTFLFVKTSETIFKIEI